MKRQNSLHQSIQRFFFNAGRDACQGDSGGPLFAKRNKTKNRYELLQHEIVGITSVGRDCGLNGFPGKNLSILFFMYNYEYNRIHIKLCSVISKYVKQQVQ